MKILIRSLCFCLILFTIVSCSNRHSENVEATGFLNKSPQEASSRNVAGHLVDFERMNLYQNFGIMEPRVMALESDTLYISEPSLRKVYKFDATAMTLLDTLTISEGEGPGEISVIQSMDVSLGYIVIGDERQAKVQIWNKEHELVNEFVSENVFPHEVNVWDDGNVTVQSPGSMRDGFIFYTFDQDGSVTTRFGEVVDELYNPIRFSGSSVINDDHFYFAGYSEHILAKWDKSGNLQYSVTTIDDIPSEVNHPVFGGEQTVFRFSEYAIYSASWVEIYDDYWCIIHRGDWNDDAYIQYLDIYNKYSGEYMASITLPMKTIYLVMNHEQIFTMQLMDDNEVDLVIYDNTIDEIVSDISQPL